MQSSREVQRTPAASFQEWRSIEPLLEAGFSFEQALRLLKVRAAYRLEAERRRLEADRRMVFVRWLVVTGRLSEFFA
ncbi:MAG: hypothetical protein C4289_02695 [Chloroflexota bacterium]